MSGLSGSPRRSGRGRAGIGGIRGMAGACARAAVVRERERRERAALSPLGVLLVLTGLLCVALLSSAPGQAAQAQAQFRVGLRIDARLVALDIARGKVPPGGFSDTSATSRANDAAASRQSAAPSARRLKRADGSGWCVRVSVGQGRWRWRCD